MKRMALRETEWMILYPDKDFSRNNCSIYLTEEELAEYERASDEYENWMMRFAEVYNTFLRGQERNRKF